MSTFNEWLNKEINNSIKKDRILSYIGPTRYPTVENWLRQAYEAGRNDGKEAAKGIIQL